MRKLLMTTVALLLAITVVTAQPGQGKRGAPKADPYSELDLTAEQQEQIKTIRAEVRAKAKAAREQTGEKRPDRAEMQKLRQESNQAIEAVLTPAQKEKLADIKAEKKAAWEAVDKKAIKQELKAYQENEVTPVIKAARGQLNQFISAEDQVAIDRLRTVYKSKPGAKSRNEQATDAPRQRPTPEQMEARKAEAKAWREAHAEDIAELKALATKYQADVERIQTRLQPQMEAWEKERKEIVRSHLPEGAPQKAGANMEKRSKQKARGRGLRPDRAEGEAGRKKGAARNGKKDGWPKAATFLLMEG